MKYKENTSTDHLGHPPGWCQPSLGCGGNSCRPHQPGRGAQPSSSVFHYTSWHPHLGPHIQSVHTQKFASSKTGLSLLLLLLRNNYKHILIYVSKNLFVWCNHISSLLSIFLYIDAHFFDLTMHLNIYTLCLIVTYVSQMEHPRQFYTPLFIVSVFINIWRAGQKQ